MIEKFTISRDEKLYHAWPDVALAGDGRMLCVFSECIHHNDRSYTRIIVCDSDDRGRKWSTKRPVSDGTAGKDYYYNCARITRLLDGRLCIVVDRIPSAGEEKACERAVNSLFFSNDGGVSWTEPVETPLRGIVPDKLLELDSGRWILAAHHKEDGYLTQFMHYSDDHGKSWSDRITVGKQQGLNLCEASILPLKDKTLVAFMRENSGCGWDCKKTISRDNGETWGDVIDFPLPGCHRPVAGFLKDGRIMITYRFMQGGKGWVGWWTQNFFAAFTDVESALADTRNGACARILPVDYDRSPKSDLGYSGWVQFDDGEIYIVNYILDDWPLGQIRGYALLPDDIMLKGSVS